jgi:hypothetical protein
VTAACTPDHVLAGGAPMHVNLNRATSRQILPTDLEDVYHLGEHLDDYETASPRPLPMAGRTVETYWLELTASTPWCGNSVCPMRGRTQACVRSTGTFQSNRPPNSLRHQALEDVFTIAADAQKVSLGLGCSATIWMGTQRQSGWPFRRSRRGDDCRGPTITQGIFS